MAALAGLLALTGCAELGYANGRYGDYGDYRRAPVPTRNDNYGRTSRYRSSVERDARQYVDQLDRHLRISNREEREIRDLLIRRTYQLLDRTAYSRHGSVYPFPRHYGEARGWWAQIDRDIERILDRRYWEPYRYYNRYGSVRYTDYYRYRRYDQRRGWYDTRRNDRRYDNDRRDDRRYDDGRRDRRADERRAEQRREEQRRADRQQDRRRETRQDRRETRQDRREDRRETRQDRRETRQDRRQETRRDRRQDRNTPARTDRRDNDRGSSRSADRRSDRDNDRSNDRRRRGNDE
ncbi:MAG: hypothetical protein CMM84_01510 [Rhodothermaceae bacterium]|nr:hypothetical protein [Rhodothermaceae bacterium]MBC13781.1 hypothetical protein [Rhodothermaceae bacterium]